MPYKIIKEDDGYKVCKKDNTKCFSKEPLTLENAEKQLKAIGMNTHLKGKGKPKNKELYEKIKKEIYEKYPKHSLFRSALIVKEYKKQGGEYEGEDNKMNIKKWFKQKWISANDYLRDKIVPCGNANTEEDYNEYPLCRPKKILEKMTKDELKKLIDEKNDLKEKHLITKKILNTDKYNIKPTISGMGKDTTENDLKECFLKIKDIYNDSNLIIKELNNKLIGLGKNKTFENQLKEIGLTADDYLNLVKIVAKHRNYNPELLKISDDGIHKLEYNNIKFGRVGYNDLIIYTWLEYNKMIPEGTAKLKKINYRKRARAIMIKTKNKYSPASLSYQILWTIFIFSFFAMIF